jgi:hypothetical protein
MRDLFLLVLFVCFLLIGSMVSGVELRIGIKAGADLGWIGGRDLIVDLNDLDDSGEAETTAKAGFSGGLSLILGLTETFSIQQEILYTMFGGSYSYTASGNGMEGTQIAHVLEIPVFLRAQMPVKPGALYAFAGPDVIFFLSDIKIRQDTEQTTSKPDYPVLLGLSVGLGYELPVGSGIMSFDLRGTTTVTEIYKKYVSNFTTMYFLVGYGWQL